jgi:cold shock CspA family protein
MAVGVIAHLVESRRFGFIRDHGGQDLYFRAAAVQGVAFETLRLGERVEFHRQADPGRGRDQAVNVRPVQG